MIKSMTGYGNGLARLNDLIVDVEVKSLNSRFLDISVRLPKSQANNEFILRDIIKGKISRGKVSLNVFVQKEGYSSKFFEIDEVGLLSAIETVNVLKEKAEIKTELNFSELMQFQSIFFSDSFSTSEVEFELTKEALNNALGELLKMKNQEGKILQKDLQGRIDFILQKVNEIEKKIPLEIENYFNKLKSRAKQLLEDIDHYDDRLKIELALLAEKYDITEEVVRMKSHLNFFSEALLSEVEIGKRLNFLCQEMNREVNTINSKSISSEVSYLAINIKEELEKLREQVQNIE